MMILLRKVLVVLSGLVVLLFAVELLLISLTEPTNVWMLQQSQDITQALYRDPTLRMISLGSSGIFLLTCLSVFFSMISFGRREKTISLPTPYGEVTIALGAIEDFIKVAKDHVQGVHELRPKVFVRGNGLKIYIRASVYSDQSIAGVAQDIQETIRRYVQETLGIEQPVEIRVFVGKIRYRAPSTDQPAPSRGIQYQEFRH